MFYVHTYMEKKKKKKGFQGGFDIVGTSKERNDYIDRPASWGTKSNQVLTPICLEIKMLSSFKDTNLIANVKFKF